MSHDLGRELYELQGQRNRLLDSIQRAHTRLEVTEAQISRVLVEIRQCGLLGYLEAEQQITEVAGR